MNTTTAHRVIFASMLLTVAVGAGTKVLKKGQWPSIRYIVGVSITYLVLSGLAEWEPQVATPLAGGILATTVLGDGNGLLSWFDTGELNTKKPATKKPTKKPAQLPPGTYHINPGHPSSNLPPIPGRITNPTH